MPEGGISNKELLDILEKKIDSRFAELSQQIEQNHNELNEKLIQSNDIVSSLKKENAELHARVDFLESKIRKKNIAIFGLQEVDDKSLLDHTIREVNNLLEIQITHRDIDNIYKPTHVNSKVPVIVELTTQLKKREIFENLPKLKLKGSPVFITHDLSKEERKINKFLRQKMIEAKNNNFDAKIKGKKLIINGKEFSYNSLVEGQIDVSSLLDANGSNEKEVDSGVVEKPALCTGAISKSTLATSRPKRVGTFKNK